MKDFRLAALSVNVMWNFCTIFNCEIMMLGKFVSFVPSCTFVYSKSGISRGRGGYHTYGRAATRRQVRNNREGDDGFEYLRN
jgi:hypothetical protein